jgi:hypothetical protein
LTVFLLFKKTKAQAKIINKRTEHATPAAIFVALFFLPARRNG